jgi:hypothetical protein
MAAFIDQYYNRIRLRTRHWAIVRRRSSNAPWPQGSRLGRHACSFSDPCRTTVQKE